MHPKYYEAKEKIRNLQESDKIITPEIIAKETNISIELIYANSDLRELIKNNCTNKMDIFKKRLKKAYNSLLKKNKQLTIRNITAEAKMARKTLYKYKELHQYIKILFFSNKKQQLIRAKTHLQRNNQAISIRTLLKKRVLEKVGGIVLKI
jgi:paraquat-inducible protein B